MNKKFNQFLYVLFITLLSISLYIYYITTYKIEDYDNNSLENILKVKNPQSCPMTTEQEQINNIYIKVDSVSTKMDNQTDTLNNMHTILTNMDKELKKQKADLEKAFPSNSNK
jgi:hypothetical protein